jgi:hypothetical protein
MPRSRQPRGRLHAAVNDGSSTHRNSSIGSLYRFAEADDCSDDTAAPTVDRLQLGRSLETAAYLARNWKFESISLQQRVCELSVPGDAPAVTQNLSRASRALPM